MAETQEEARMSAREPYRCAMCGGEYVSDWSDEQALEETERVHGWRPTGSQLESPDDPSTDPYNDYCVICDDCWQAYLQWGREHGVTVEAN